MQVHGVWSPFSTTALIGINMLHIPSRLQVYLPMSYVYGIRGTCKETALTAAIRCVAGAAGVTHCIVLACAGVGAVLTDVCCQG